MQRIEQSGLVYYQFDSLQTDPDLVHGVFTRLGGVSLAPHDSLNVGATVGDDLTNVHANRQRIAQTLGFDEADTRTTWQIHGADVVVIRGRAQQEAPPPQADAIVTAERDLPLVMRFADCAPIILYDPVRQVIGMAHAGWRGTVAGVAQAVVETMKAAFDSDPADVIAGIGPAIGPCCYEVGPEVVNAVEEAFGDTSALIHFPNGKGGRAHFDLWEANAHVLRQAGVKHIEVSGLCTADRTDEFFSHRAEHGATGRFGAVIMLRNGTDA